MFGYAGARLASNAAMPSACSLVAAAAPCATASRSSIVFGASARARLINRLVRANAIRGSRRHLCCALRNRIEESFVVDHLVNQPQGRRRLRQ